MEALDTIVNAFVLVGIGLLVGLQSRSHRTELRGEISTLRAEVREDFAQVRGEFAQVREELRSVRSDLTAVALAVGARGSTSRGARGTS